MPPTYTSASDSETVVTAFPVQEYNKGARPTTEQAEPEGKSLSGDTNTDDAAIEKIDAAKDSPNARGRILSALYGNYQSPVFTPTDLICLIIDKCTSLFHPTPQEALESESDYFEPVCGRHWRVCLLSGKNEPETLGDLDTKIDQEIRILSDITEETNCLRDIIDIMDELNSISYFFAQQVSVHRLQQSKHNKAEQAAIYAGKDASQQQGKSSKKPLGPSPDKGSSSSLTEDTFEDMEIKFTQLMRTLVKRRETIAHLKAEALRVYKDLCDILDLKQKQPAVSRALSARQESKEAKRQGQTILLFTIVTIIFLPLSFNAAIFSMNATEITGDNVNRPISEIFAVMFSPPPAF
ncbi:hypothetical protein QBC38DRAFT_531130 [Podospora fimiseda]|uniref:Uncharacterized protein n=1 Tax=Podospora fimiseda TaxID=252190 RepID=A0AAN7GYR2_9PEZI|nr:hypothetical protein QBC38DRAFT_531130 [Podospora fimiseda]